MSLNLPIAELVLERGDHGLGFNIRGGVDIPHVPGDTGIFVTRLKEDGAAFKDGRLKEGDKILEVNGKSIEKVTHNEAVQIFITAGNTVRMKVQHGAYAYLMRNRSGARGSRDGGGGQGVKIIIGVISLVAIAGIGFIVFQRMQQSA